MAIAVPGVYLRLVQGNGGRSADAEEKPWRLPPNHVQDLRDVAMGVEESNAGVCCRYLVDQLAASGTIDVDDDGYVHRLEDAERFVERYGDFGKIPAVITWRNRLRRARRAVTLLRTEGDHRSADVLFTAYGQGDPSTACLVPLFPRELANLARYTDAVELKRVDLVRLETARLATMPKRSNAPRTDGSFSAALEWMGTVNEAHRLGVETGVKVKDAETLAQVYELTRRREQFEYAARVISSGDALRAGLEPFHEPLAPQSTTENRLEFEARREARKERQKAYEAKREAFLLDVKLDAHRMLVAAEKAYHKAWLRSASADHPRLA